MKKIIVALLFSVVAYSSSQAQEAKGSAKSVFPYGCRTYTVSVNLVFADISTEVTICCVPANGKIPPVSCMEIAPHYKGKAKVIEQYFMLDELEKNLDRKIDGPALELSGKVSFEFEKEQYFFKKGIYAIETNDLKQRFVRVLFETK